MKRIHPILSILTAACALALPGIVSADDITIDPVPFVPSASRAGVRADLEGYKRSGVNPWSLTYNPLREFRGDRTRAEVTAEFLWERDAVAAMTGEDSGSSYLARHRGAAGSPVYLAAKRRQRYEAIHGGQECPPAFMRCVP